MHTLALQPLIQLTHKLARSARVGKHRQSCKCTVAAAVPLMDQAVALFSL